MRDRQGGIIGATVTPTTSAASGIWSLREAERFQRGGTWPVVDPYFSDVVLLMHANGTLADSSSAARTATAFGNAAATGAAKFGSNSLTFDGDGDYMTIPSSTDFDLGSTYTVECWINPSTSEPGGGVVHRGQYNTSTSAWSGLSFSIRGIGSGIRFYFAATTNADEQYVDVSASCFPANTWTHVAMVRDGTNGRIYAAGSQEGTISSLASTSSNSLPVYIGAWFFNVAGVDTFPSWSGLIDEVRITKNIARYSGSTIAVPAAAFPDA